MANGFGSLYIGASGLQSAQNALNTTSNNLANVNTVGYVREQVRFADKHSLPLKAETATTMLQQYGLGVSIGDVVHARDVFLDKAYRLENSRLGFYSTKEEINLYTQDLFQELDGEQFKKSVNDLWIACQELGKSPADSTNQNLVLQKAEMLLSRTSTLYSNFKSYQDNINTQIYDDVKKINKMGNRIYELNLEIQKVESGDVETAMTLRDERDQLLDELSGYTNINVTEDATGFAFVEIDGIQFIDEAKCYNIEMRRAYGTNFYTPYWPQLSDVDKGSYTDVWKTNVEISTEYNTDLGSIKAKLLARGDTYGSFQDLEDPARYAEISKNMIVETEAEISLLFHSIVTAMNDIFGPNVNIGETLGAGTTDANGKLTADLYADDGTLIGKAGEKVLILDVDKAAYGANKTLPPEELFVRSNVERYTQRTVNGQTVYVYNAENADDPETLYSLDNVSINESLKKQITLMPAYTANGAVDYTIGDRLTEVWSTDGMYITPDDKFPCNFVKFYDKMIGKLGTEGSTFHSATETMTETVGSIENQRNQVVGVSSDEELTKMIKYQAAYNAASRYITVISQMTELIVTGLI